MKFLICCFAIVFTANPIFAEADNDISAYGRVLFLSSSIRGKTGRLLVEFGKALQEEKDLDQFPEQIDNIIGLIEKFDKEYEDYIPPKEFIKQHELNKRMLDLEYRGLKELQIFFDSILTDEEKAIESLESAMSYFNEAEKLYPIFTKSLNETCNKYGINLSDYNNLMTKNTHK